ncbi:MAG: sigma D regulator [Spongiibacteraceae bacterium]|nr:sigma D regulator [Spongiibacteraceae bacterium]
MPDQNEYQKARWSAVESLIERWLSARQQLIVNYCATSGLQLLGKPGTSGSSRARLQLLCQQLLDYLSAGHFEIYYELLREAESFDDGSAALARELLPLIAHTTEIGVQFNDRYAETAGDHDAGELARDLSELGEILAERFEYEDRLITFLHAAHRQLVA